MSRLSMLFPQQPQRVSVPEKEWIPSEQPRQS
jgi:hypothetical protein